MADFSIIQKIKLLFDTVVSTPFFIVYALFGILLVVFIVFDIKKKKKISKIMYILSFLFLLTFFTIKYFSVIIKLLDSFVEIILKALYFPSLGLYILMLIIANLTLFIVLIRKFFKSYKITTVIFVSLLDFIFVMIINLIAKNNIDVTSDVKLYADSIILTLLQISMALFVSLYLLFFLFALYHKFKLYDKNVTFDNEVLPDMGLYVKNNNNSFFNDNDINIFKIIDFTKKNGEQ